MTTLGTLFASAFVVGSAAADGSDRIIYDATTGTLYYDSDGTGATAQVRFAVLSTKPVISHLDFVVV